jgi:hypothetical protein
LAAAESPIRERFEWAAKGGDLPLAFEGASFARLLALFVVDRFIDRFISARRHIFRALN